MVRADACERVIRPASYCGVAACKPTYNLLPRAGVHPNADSLDTVGVYGRSVEDAHTKHQYDLYYIQEMSPFLDMVILLKTLQTLLFRPGI